NFMGFGGAICADEITVETSSTATSATAAIFEGNEANSGKGGAIYAGGSIVVEYVQFKSNKGEIGGAIYASEDIDFVGEKLEGNEASDKAGAVYVVGDALFTSTSIIDNNTATGNGGALYVCGVTNLINTVLSGNTAGTQADSVAKGGALYVLDDITFDGASALTGNIASGDGGAIYLEQGILNLADQATVQLLGNYAGGDGGALCTMGDMDLPANVAVTGNTAAHSGGGIYAVGKITIANHWLYDNNAGEDGGALAANDVEIVNSRIYNNSAKNGGGVYAIGKVVVENTSIYNNKALVKGDDPLANGGAIAAADVVVVNSEIFGNTAKTGGGLYAGKTLKLVNATITQNSATGQGGGLFVATDGTSIINNSIIAINHAGDASVNTDETNDVQISGTYTLAHLLIGVGDGLSDATGTKTYYYHGKAADPLDPGFELEFSWDTTTGTWTGETDLYHQLTLEASSVAINNGDNALAVYEDGTAISRDILGHPRIYVDAEKPVNIVDFGAYEFQQSVLCDLAFYQEGEAGTTTRTGEGGTQWSVPVILSKDTAGDPMTPISGDIKSSDPISVGVSFFNSDKATGTCAREFTITVTCYRYNSNGEPTVYGKAQEHIVGDETYILKKGESDFFVLNWGVLGSGTYYFKVELNSADQDGEYAFEEVTRDNNIYTTSSIVVKHDDVIIVNTAEDYPLEGDWESDTKVSLREALRLAEIWSSEDDKPNTDLRKIRFSSDVDWANNPILLNKDCVTDIVTGVDQSKQVYGTLCVTCSIDLVGEDALGNSLNITVDGQDAVRIFQIADYHDGEKVASGQTPEQGLIATIENMTLMHGNATKADVSNDTVSAAGGAVASAARGTADQYGLTLKNVSMSSNVASSGGAVKNVGKMKVDNCEIINNQTQYDADQVTYAGDFGGGVYNSGELYITQSTISGNTAGKYGGGIVSYGNSNWETSHISYGKVEIYNTVLSGNSAAYGGGICLSPTAAGTEITLGNVTIVGNVATTQGGGLWYSSKADLSVENSIIYGNVCVANPLLYDNVYSKSSTTETVMKNSIYSSTPVVNFVNFPTGTSFVRTGWSGWDLRIASTGDANVVDQGNNSYAAGMTEDRDGNARINASTGIVDLGAYEWYSELLGISATSAQIQTGKTSLATGTEIATFSTKLADDTGVTYTTTSDDFSIDENKLVTKRDLTAGSYSVAVAATKADGSAYDTRTWTIVVSAPSLVTPSVASSYQVDGDEVFLTWSNVEGATGFRVRYKLLGDTQWTYAGEECSGTSGIVRGAFTVGGTYVFQVQAVGGQFNSDSEWSDAQRTMQLAMAAASASGNVDLNGWSSRQCVTIEYRTPSFETNLSELLDGQIVKLSAKVERSRSISVVGWNIYWGDGSSSEFRGLFNSITSTHYYQAEGTYCISLKMLDSQGAGNDVLYYIGSHTFGTANNAVVQETPVAAVAVEEEVVESASAGTVSNVLVTGSAVSEVVVTAASTSPLETIVLDSAKPTSGSSYTGATLETRLPYTRRNWAMNQRVQNLQAVKTDRCFASLSESDELDTGLDYGF
ncbi:MAG: hypothetical protein PHQ75_10740, partial [Thermoguttaceae bacterium]|nr:hypothetical protein [Thermoguttaceae bacterium]